MRVRYRVNAEGALLSLFSRQQRVRTLRQEATRQVAELALQRVVQGNPVETGRSRSSWVSAGAEAGLQVSGDWQGSDADAMQEGGTAGRGELNEEDLRTQFILENQVLYVPFLEYGTSRMEARAMVRRGLQQTSQDGPPLMADILFR